MEKRNEEDDRIKLYEASVRGYVPTLKELIEKDPLVLNNISLMSLPRSLLHISASLGHLDFTITLLNYKPKLATKLDSHNRSALHLASAEGHIEIVKALIDVNKDVCLIADEEGRIPLHYAAMTGHIEVIQLLINERQESIRVKAEREKTVLHLCVLNNHLEALKLLVECVNDDFEFLNLKDCDGGNTILHLAVMLKQVETTKYLLSRPGIQKNAKNGIGSTALDVIKHCSRDLEIRNLLTMKGVEIAKNQNDLPPPLLATGVPIESVEPLLVEWWWENGKQFLKDKIKKWIGPWRCTARLEKTREAWMLVSTVITTTTFQSAINPPGGVWQSNSNSTDTGSGCSNKNKCVAGTAVLAYSYRHAYVEFFFYNTVSFIASLCVFIMLISGVSLKKNIYLWLLTIGMTLTLIFMGLAYLHAMWLVTPDDVKLVDDQFFETMIYCLWILAGFNTLRFITWLGSVGKKLYKKLSGCKTLTGPGNMSDHP